MFAHFAGDLLPWGKSRDIFWWKKPHGKNHGKQNVIRAETPRTKKKHMAKKKDSFFCYGGETISFLLDGVSSSLATNSHPNRDILRFCDWPGGLFTDIKFHPAHYKWDNCDPRIASDVRWTKSLLNGDICFDKIQVWFHEPSRMHHKTINWLKICLPRFELFHHMADLYEWILRTFDPTKCLSWLLLIQRFRSPTSFCI